jgi:hypothetical protein
MNDIVRTTNVSVIEEIREIDVRVVARKIRAMQPIMGQRLVIKCLQLPQVHATVPPNYRLDASCAPNVDYTHPGDVGAMWKLRTRE